MFEVKEILRLLEWCDLSQLDSELLERLLEQLDLMYYNSKISEAVEDEIDQQTWRIEELLQLREAH